MRPVRSGPVRDFEQAFLGPLCSSRRTTARLPAGMCRLGAALLVPARPVRTVRTVRTVRAYNCRSARSTGQLVGTTRPAAHHCIPLNSLRPCVLSGCKAVGSSHWMDDGEPSSLDFNSLRMYMG